MPQSPADGKRILNSIRLLVRALRLFDREAQSKHGISAAQAYVLHTLNEEDGLSLNELADRTATDQSSASVVVQRLVDAGLVSRTARKEDRRHVELRLTAKGRNVIRKSPPPAQQKMLAAAESMSPRDRKAFADMLEDFIAMMGVRGRKAPMLFEDDVKPSAKRAAK
ncbi:MAG: MarR family winged helix-turn-helix transcriptional regulator [Thermoanaerobaculia bacterium]